MGQSWQADVTAYVIQLKRAGIKDFEFAYEQACKTHPPSLKDRRRIEPWEEADLFHQDVVEEPCVVEAMRGYLRDAWHGRNRGVARFSLRALVEDVDETSSSSHNEEFRLAA